VISGFRLPRETPRYPSFHTALVIGPAMQILDSRNTHPPGSLTTVARSNAILLKSMMQYMLRVVKAGIGVGKGACCARIRGRGGGSAMAFSALSGGMRCGIAVP